MEQSSAGTGRTAAPLAPQSLDAEEYVIGAMLLAPKIIPAVRAEVEPTDFYRASNGTIFRIAVEIHERGDPLDAVSLVAELGRCGLLEEIGGKTRVHELASIVPASANAPHHARLVRRAAGDRERLDALLTAEQKIRDGRLDPETRARVVDALAEEAPTAGPAWYESAANLLAEPDPGPTPFLVEGLIVDRAVAAIQGPPKVGKTWLVLDLAVAIVTGGETLGFSGRNPGPVLVVLEESGRAALHRRLGQLARGKAIRPEALAGLHVATNQGVQLDDPVWPERIVAAANEIGARAILFDPLARVKGASVDENVQREIGPVLDTLRNIRERTGAAVVFVHHTPHDGRHLRGSSDIEATWESKLSVSRDDSGVCSVVAEHREAESGPMLRYRLAFDGLTESVRLTLVEEPDAEAKRKAELQARVAAIKQAEPGLSATKVIERLREEGVKLTDSAGYAAVRAVESAETTETLADPPEEPSTRCGTPTHRSAPGRTRPPGGGAPAGDIPKGIPARTDGAGAVRVVGAAEESALAQRPGPGPGTEPDGTGRNTTGPSELPSRGSDGTPTLDDVLDEEISALVAEGILVDELPSGGKR